MPEADNNSENTLDSPAPDGARTTPTGLRYGVAAVAVAVVVGGWVIMNSGSSTPPTPSRVPPGSAVTTTQPGGTQPSVTTTLARLTPQYSPFAANLLSRDGPVPDSPAIEGSSGEIYVDPDNGDDAAPGTVGEPVATLEAAQLLARPLLRDATGDVVVYLRQGLHYRTGAFTLTSQDSGRDQQRMVYRSYPGEQAVIEGGVQVTAWEPAFGSVVKAAVPDAVADVRQFFASGLRQQRARTPQPAGSAKRFIKEEVLGSPRDVAIAVDSSLVADFAHPEDLELVYVGVAVSGHGVERGDGSEILRPSWKAHRLPVATVSDLGNGTTSLLIDNGALHHASERGYAPLEILPTDEFFLENALELLDEPGEWYFDSREMTMYWWPPNEAAPADAWIAATEVLLAIDGTLERPVRNVAIEGIAFRHAGYNRVNDEGYVVSQAASWFTSWKLPSWMEEGQVPHSFTERAEPPGLAGAAIEIDSARDVTFRANVFTELGANGVLVSNDARRIEFDANLFVDISAGAFVAGHPEHDEIDEPTEGPIGDISFTNNVVDRAGAEFYASAGVQITKSDGAVISNNLFRDLPYSALSLGWGWANNVDSDVHRAIRVENNYFENVVNVLYDGAPIYLLGPVAEVGAPRSEYTHIKGNFANNLGAAPQFKAPTDKVASSFGKRPGIQLDRGVRNTIMANNVFTGSTAWFQLTAWQENRNRPEWIESLGLVGSGNWSDIAESVPDNTTLVGVARVKLFDLADLPERVAAIIAAAGLEPGIELPPLP